MISWVLSGLRRSEAQQGTHQRFTTSVYCKQDIDEELKAMSIDNRVTGYSLVLDSAARIRWMVSAPIDNESKQAFGKVIQSIVKEC